MKVLFVSSGNNKKNGISPFISEQAESLKREGVEVEHFLIKGTDIVPYLKNIPKLRNLIKLKNYDLIHAHFILSAWVSLLTLSGKPIILSLMGSDAIGKPIGENKIAFFSRYLTLLTFAIQPFVAKIISKAKNIENYVLVKSKSVIIPNGVDLNKFLPLRENFSEELGITFNGKRILFMGNPTDKNKNFAFLESIKEKLERSGYIILAPYPVPHDKVVKYFNSVDLMVMCSFSEGSPNIVKEAMACNCKAVLTDVGDVRYLVEGVEGYEITEFNSDNLYYKILKVIEQNKCDGRQRLIDLKLDIQSVAIAIKNLYSSVLS